MPFSAFAPRRLILPVYFRVVLFDATRRKRRKARRTQSAQQPRAALSRRQKKDARY
jgi:hypothetical protein